MPNLRRSPPLSKSHSMSESDVDKAGPFSVSRDEIVHITQRDHKRRRVTDECSETSDLRQIVREELHEMICALQSQQNSRLDVLEKYISEIKLQNDTTHRNHLDIEKSIEFVASKVDDIQVTINRLEEQRKEIASQIAHIEEKCETRERLSRKTSVLIRNIPKQKSETKEKLFEMVKKLSTTLGIKIEECGMRDVYRTPSKPNQNTTGIIAEFTSTLLKEKLLTAAKTHKLNSLRFKTEQLNSSHMGLDGPKVEIYLSEHLTPQRHKYQYIGY
ncbi:unnamed protein product [Arctia plantaginis]|uniref:Uncharacterized protein n=1 Tax=Arctia plantaginis TaxID=874455 RepID=A0A8S0YR23_ARCPL|nr:unnamed protein product [Arctia plantaginis]